MTLLMGFILLAAVPDSTAPPRVIVARFTEVAPQVDGNIEDLWQMADSATGFTQLAPDYGRPATESTTAYVLYDSRCIYAAFRCLARDATKVRAQLSGLSDGIRLFLDTFDDNSSCYQFIVSASGAEQNYRITENGADVQTWDGIWYSAARVHNWGYAVEIAVPFKTLRYPGSVSGSTHPWGIDFCRYFASRAEKSYWSRHDQTSFRVERFGTVTGIRPPPAGLHMEVFPVALGRADKTGLDRTGWRDSLSAGYGLDLSWLPTPTANIQLTALPDFAQIEADPYQVNLTKYELRLDERRPFFVEAAENFGTGSNWMRLFYSRRIGKALPDGSLVPVLGGAKYTDRIGRYQLGALGAITPDTRYDYYGTDTLEPASLYTVASLRRQVLQNSDIGLLYAGKDQLAAGPVAFANHAMGFDGTYRRGDLTAWLAGAGSLLGDSGDYALLGELGYAAKTFSFHARGRHIGPEFDANAIGFTPWHGRNGYVAAGPVVYATGPFQYAEADAYVEVNREGNNPNPAPDWGTGVSSYATFRNRMCASFWLARNRTWYSRWETDTSADTLMQCWGRYDGVNVGTTLGTDATRPASIGFYADYSTVSYNYNRMVLAPLLQGNVWAGLQLTDQIDLSFEAPVVLEFPDTGKLNLQRDATVMLRPRFDMSVTPKMTVGVGNELVRTFDVQADRTDVSHRLAALYSYTFRPRSTVYFAWNWETGTGRAVTLVQVLKIRYLFVF